MEKVTPRNSGTAAGKGDGYRKVDQKKYDKNYKKIFGNKKKYK